MRQIQLFYIVFLGVITIPFGAFSQNNGVKNKVDTHVKAVSNGEQSQLKNQQVTGTKMMGKHQGANPSASSAHSLGVFSAKSGVIYNNKPVPKDTLDNRNN